MPAVLFMSACTPVNWSFFQPTTVDKAFNHQNLEEQLKNDSLTIPLRVPKDIYQWKLTETKPTVARINVSVHEIEAREFFMGLVLDSNKNMVVHPDVRGKISLTLKSVTIPQILDVVQRVYGYEFKQSDIGYLVYPITLQTKIFKMNRLDLLREGFSNTLVPTDFSSSQGSSNNQQGNSNNGSSQNSSRVAGSWVKTTTGTDFWQELQQALEIILSVDSEAKVTINRQSGLVVVRAKPMQLREIEQFLDVTQQQIGRQVILEAKVLEVILNDGHKDGVDWGSIIRQGANVAPLLTGAPSEIYKFVLTHNGNFKPLRNFSAIVDLLEQQGKTNVLSSPRISTLNNQKAIIKVGENEYFITNVSSSNSTTNNTNNTNTNSLPTATLESFFSGITLDVTPQINDGGQITLHIHPTISKTENLNKQFTIFGEDFSIPTALSSVRESDSIVKIRDGQIIVLGGLMQEENVDTKEGLTAFSRIPYLGHLFRVDNGKKQKSELIILLRASLMTKDSDWQQDIENSRQRFHELDLEPRWQRAF